AAGGRSHRGHRGRHQARDRHHDRRRPGARDRRHGPQGERRPDRGRHAGPEPGRGIAARQRDPSPASHRTVPGVRSADAEREVRGSGHRRGHGVRRLSAGWGRARARVPRLVRRPGGDHMTATAGNPGTPRWRAAGTAGAALVGVAAGGVLWAVGEPAAADTLWASTTALLLIPLTWSVVRSLARRDFGVDVIALLSMAGALAVGQYLAGAVVAVMLAGGNTLEAYAQQRARRELSLLVSRIPTTANLRRGDEIVTVPVAAVAVADSMLIRGGEIVPADGTLMSQDAVIDTAALTGEPLPVHLRRGEDVASGSVNAGAAIEIAATRPADESTYAALVRLVRAAERSQAPFVRMADRYAAWFLPITLALAALGWAVSGDPVRAVAVLVIATPCPLILAAPVALVSGVSRAARAGVIVKGAAVIEQLGAVDTVMLDKTGTLTLGVPMVERVEPSGPIGESELLSLAASVDQASAHVMAKALVEKARSDGLDIVFPGHLFETPGQGIRGEVEGRPVAVG